MNTNYIVYYVDNDIATVYLVYVVNIKCDELECNAN